jgi:undecaprenyl-diphosphatase
MKSLNSLKVYAVNGYHNPLRFVALAAALLAAVAFVWLAHITTLPPVIAWNEAVLRTVAALRTPALDALLLLATRFGNPWLVAGLLGVLGLLLLLRRRWADLIGIATAGGGAWLLTEGLKHYYHRARPLVVSTPLEVSSYSFPSAHALGAMVGYGALLVVGLRLVRRTGLRWLLLIVLPPLIMLIGASRVYWGVHFVTDVLAGFLVGLAWLLVAVQVVWLVERSQARHADDPASFSTR